MQFEVKRLTLSQPSQTSSFYSGKHLMILVVKGRHRGLKRDKNFSIISFLSTSHFYYITLANAGQFYLSEEDIYEPGK